MDRFYEIIRALKPIGLNLPENRTLMETSLKRAIRYLEAHGDLKSTVHSLQKLQGRVLEKITELRTPNKFSVLVHGDFWFNNILIKDKDEGSEESRVRIVDLQACAFQSPAVDIWLFLYTSILPSLLESNRDSLIKLYSSTLLDVMHTQNTPPDHIPSPETIEEEILSREEYGFLVAVAYLPALYLRRELIGEIGKASEEEKKEIGFLDRFVSPDFKERIIEVARYCDKKRIL